MRLVIRFTGAPDPVVRRRVESVARSMRPGQSKSFVLNGYICRIVAKSARTVATVIDTPMRLLGVSNGTFRIAQYPFGFTNGGDRNRLSPFVTGDVESVAWTASRFFTLAYGVAESLFPVRHIGQPLAYEAQGMMLMSADPNAPANHVALDAAQSIEGAALVRWYSPVPVQGLFRDSWLSDLFGPRTRFAGAYSTNVRGPSLPTPTPAVPGQTVYFNNWDTPVPRQLCCMAVQPADQVAVVAAPIMHMPENQLAFYDLDGFGDFRWGVRDPEFARAGVPGLLIMRVAATEITQEEADALGVSYGSADAPPSWYEESPTTRAPSYMQVLTATELEAADWPAYFAPEVSPNARVADPGGGAIERPLFVDVSGIPSYFPVTLGAVYSTLVGDTAEFMVGVKAVSEFTVPMSTTYRAADPIVPGEYALIRYTRVGLMRVQVDVNSGVTTAASMFEDVIGSEDCPAYNPSMSASVAYMPQVMWGGVLAGKRCYAVRAVRYARSKWLGSIIQPLSANPAFTSVYTGFTGADSSPLFFTDSGFGPYPDATPEEFWWIVDGVKTVVALDSGRRAQLRTDIDQINMTVTDADLTPFCSRGWLSSMALRPETPANSPTREYALSEFVPQVAVQQQFTQVAEGAVVYYVPQANDVGGTLQLRRFDAQVGSDTAVGTVSTPWPYAGKPQYGLTCYQWESEVDGDPTPACFLLTVAGESNGYVLQSIDGGVTWETLLESPDSYPDGRVAGIAPLGYHFIGTALFRADRTHPFIPPVE